MKKQLLFVGDKFMMNKPLQRYILRILEQKIGTPDAIYFFQESDNSLFLHLESEMPAGRIMLIVTTKSSFPVIGKLLSTVTSDNQVLKEGMLIPSRTEIYEAHSYLIHHDRSSVNVMMAAEGEQLPNILIETEQRSALVHIFDEDEESIRAVLEPLARTFEVRLQTTQLVTGWLQLHIQSGRHGNLANFINAAKQLLPRKIIAAGNIALYIIERLMRHRKKLTMAESCTGGLIASWLTRESGASNIFEGSLVTYSNALKSNWLAVSDHKLETCGAVSEEVVEEMTEGAMNVSYADYAIAVSGIAGPDGGSEQKPVGTVFIGVRSKRHSIVEKYRFYGDRNYIQEQSMLIAVKMLLHLDKETFFEA